MRTVEDKVMIEQDEAESKIGSFAISETSREKPRQGTIVVVGPGENNKAMETKVGDKVIYGEFSGHVVSIEGKEYVILREKELLVII